MKVLDQLTQFYQSFLHTQSAHPVGREARTLTLCEFIPGLSFGQITLDEGINGYLNRLLTSIKESSFSLEDFWIMGESTLQVARKHKFSELALGLKFAAGSGSVERLTYLPLTLLRDHISVAEILQTPGYHFSRVQEDDENYCVIRIPFSPVPLLLYLIEDRHAPTDIEKCRISLDCNSFAFLRKEAEIEAINGVCQRGTFEVEENLAHRQRNGLYHYCLLLTKGYPPAAPIAAEKAYCRGLDHLDPLGEFIEVFPPSFRKNFLRNLERVLHCSARPECSTLLKEVREALAQLSDVHPTGYLQFASPRFFSSTAIFSPSSYLLNLAELLKRCSHEREELLRDQEMQLKRAGRGDVLAGISTPFQLFWSLNDKKWRLAALEIANDDEALGVFEEALHDPDLAGRVLPRLKPQRLLELIAKNEIPECCRDQAHALAKKKRFYLFLLNESGGLQKLMGEEKKRLIQLFVDRPPAAFFHQRIDALDLKTFAFDLAQDERDERFLTEIWGLLHFYGISDEQIETLKGSYQQQREYQKWLEQSPEKCAERFFSIRPEPLITNALRIAAELSPDDPQIILLLGFAMRDHSQSDRPLVKERVLEFVEAAEEWIRHDPQWTKQLSLLIDVLLQSEEPAIATMAARLRACQTSEEAFESAISSDSLRDIKVAAFANNWQKAALLHYCALLTRGAVPKDPFFIERSFAKNLPDAQQLKEFLENYSDPAKKAFLLNFQSVLFRLSLDNTSLDQAAAQELKSLAKVSKEGARFFAIAPPKTEEGLATLVAALRSSPVYRSFIANDFALQGFPSLFAFLRGRVTHDIALEFATNEDAEELFCEGIEDPEQALLALTKVGKKRSALLFEEFKSGKYPAALADLILFLYPEKGSESLPKPLSTLPAADPRRPALIKIAEAIAQEHFDAKWQAGEYGECATLFPYLPAENKGLERLKELWILLKGKELSHDLLAQWNSLLTGAADSLKMDPDARCFWAEVAVEHPDPKKISSQALPLFYRLLDHNMIVQAAKLLVRFPKEICSKAKVTAAMVDKIIALIPHLGRNEATLLALIKRAQGNDSWMVWTKLLGQELSDSLKIMILRDFAEECRKKPPKNGSALGLAQALLSRTPTVSNKELYREYFALISQVVKGMGTAELRSLLPGFTNFLSSHWRWLPVDLFKEFFCSKLRNLKPIEMHEVLKTVIKPIIEEVQKEEPIEGAKQLGEEMLDCVEAILNQFGERHQFRGALLLFIADLVHHLKAYARWEAFYKRGFALTMAASNDQDITTLISCAMSGYLDHRLTESRDDRQYLALADLFGKAVLEHSLLYQDMISFFSALVGKVMETSEDLPIRIYQKLVVQIGKIYASSPWQSILFDLCAYHILKRNPQAALQALDLACMKVSMLYNILDPGFEVALGPLEIFMLTQLMLSLRETFRASNPKEDKFLKLALNFFQKLYVTTPSTSEQMSNPACYPLELVDDPVLLANCAGDHRQIETVLPETLDEARADFLKEILLFAESAAFSRNEELAILKRRLQQVYLSKVIQKAQTSLMDEAKRDSPEATRLLALFRGFAKACISFSQEGDQKIWKRMKFVYGIVKDQHWDRFSDGEKRKFALLGLAVQTALHIDGKGSAETIEYCLEGPFNDLPGQEPFAEALLLRLQSGQTDEGDPQIGGAENGEALFAAVCDHLRVGQR